MGPHYKIKSADCLNIIVPLPIMAWEHDGKRTETLNAMNTARKEDKAERQNKEIQGMNGRTQKRQNM